MKDRFFVYSSAISQVPKTVSGTCWSRSDQGVIKEGVFRQKWMHLRRHKRSWVIIYTSPNFTPIATQGREGLRGRNHLSNGAAGDGDLRILLLSAFWAISQSTFSNYHMLSLLSCWPAEFNINLTNTFHDYKTHLRQSKSNLKIDCS